MAVAPHERCDCVLEKRVMSFLRQQLASASLRQTRIEHVASDRVGQRMMNSAKQPMMIEEHKDDLHVGVAGDLERRIDIVEKLLVETGGKTAGVVDDSGQDVAEDEPTCDDEAEGGHLREIARDGAAARRHAEM